MPIVRFIDTVAGQAVPGLRRTWERQRWLWCTAMLLLVAAGAGSIQVDRLRGQHAALAREFALLSGTGQQAATPPVQLRPRFALPSIGELSQVASDLQTVSQQHGLSVLDVSFSPGPMASSGIARMNIKAHLRGSYAGAKRTLASLLATHDGMALDSIWIRRTDGEGSGVDVELHFTLFLMGAEP